MGIFLIDIIVNDIKILDNYYWLVIDNGVIVFVVNGNVVNYIKFLEFGLDSYVFIIVIFIVGNRLWLSLKNDGVLIVDFIDNFFM